MLFQYLKNNQNRGQNHYRSWSHSRLALAVIIGLAVSLSVQAQDSGKDERWRVSGTLSTDDVEHGFSRTLGDPGAQAWIAYKDPSGWIAGFQAKTIDFVANGLPNQDLYVSLRGFAGYEWAIADLWKVRVSGHYINFPGSTTDNSSYEEVFAEVFYSDLVSFKADYGHDRYTLKEDSILYELAGHYPLMLGYTLDAMYGYHDADDLLGGSYNYYSVGVNKRFGPFDIGLRYHDTSSRGDELFTELGVANGLDLSDVTDSGLLMSFSARSDVFEQAEWERWEGFRGFSSSVDIVSNYVSKGVSQTEDNPAVQLSVDYGWDNGIYTGIWVSNVDYVPTGKPNDGADFEVDYYLGYSFEPMEGFGLDISYVYYNYPGIEASIETDFDYGELIVGASYGRWGAKIGYSNDQVASDETGTWYQGTADFDLIAKLSLNVEVGHYDRSNFGNSYNWWGAGLSYDVGEFDIGLTATQTSSAADRDNTGGEADDKLVANVSYSF
ncbi:TorF family putative porin [Paraglaciecola sp. L1A13]|uniref:TorF family putative porin n=1 Tax=Paraglaciecola sp. L1A13 TaxID=2686359 RepID=UPI00131C167D|nr:TorF family putative porin [Paraglaciecola sp. L1A13]